MRRTIIMNLPMTRDIKPITYISKSINLKISNMETKYILEAFLAENMSSEDEINFVLLAKQSSVSKTEEHKTEFIKSMDLINETIGAKINYNIINTEYSEEKHVHEKLMSDIIDCIRDGDHLSADITFGPKDEPIIIFSVLEFAEHFLDCEIDHILYGQVNFVDGIPVSPGIVNDMIPLYTLNSFVKKLPCANSDVARKTLKSFISMNEK